MVRTLLIRGMLVGVIAGLLTFGFSKIFGEPQVDRAIAFEIHMDAAKAAHDAAPGMHHTAQDAATGIHHEDEPELVSRSLQAGLGLFTGVVVYCTAFGGLFALVFAAANGRVGKCSPRAMAALLAGAGFVAIYLVPALKYPANPPAVGHPDTIDQRTALYFTMMLISVAAMVGAAMLRNMLARRHGAWSAALIAGAGYLVVVFAAQLLLPSINEVPEQFPAVLLWNFRIASLGTQAVMWTTLGLLFGWLTERAAARQRGSSRTIRFAATQT
jgi:predicted cobalt transporter CbtA